MAIFQGTNRDEIALKMPVPLEKNCTRTKLRVTAAQLPPFAQHSA